MLQHSFCFWVLLAKVDAGLFSLGLKHVLGLFSLEFFVSFRFFVGMSNGLQLTIFHAEASKKPIIELLFIAHGKSGLGFDF